MLSKSESIAQLSLESMVTVTSCPDLRLCSKLDVIHSIVWWLLRTGGVSKHKILDYLPNLDLYHATKEATQLLITVY